MESVNRATLVVLLSPWAVWLCWEVCLLARRAGPGPKVKTISMVARDLRYHMTSVVFLTSGMAAHWWVPWRAATVAGSIFFWVNAALLLAWDVLLRDKPPETWAAWERLARTPWVWLILGAASGLVLFPQGA